MIIDVRNRPPTPEFDSFFTTASVTRINSRLGVPTPSAFTNRSVDQWAGEIRDSPVDKVAVVSRNTPTAQITNEYLSDFQSKYSDFVIGVAGIDINRVIHDPISELRKCTEKLNLHAVAIDPGASGGSRARQSGSYPNDPDFFTFYEACSELDIPVFMMTGPFAGRDATYGHPDHMDHILGEFPNLKMIAGHGSYPYATEACSVAYKRPNFYISPDVYMFAPGAGPYIEAARKFLDQQMMFGTAYPFAPVAEMLAASEELDLGEARDLYMGGNAARVLEKSIKALA